MYPVSLAFVVAFHPNLKLEEIFVVRSFNHSFDQLNDVGYLLSETQYFQPIITRQFREFKEAVFKKKEMFYVNSSLSLWLSEKFFDGSMSPICYQSKVSKVRIRQNVQFSILTSLWAHEIVQMKRSQPISTLVFQRSMTLSEIFFMRTSSNTPTK